MTDAQLSLLLRSYAKRIAPAICKVLSKGQPLMVINETHRNVMFYKGAPAEVQVCVELQESVRVCESLEAMRTRLQEGK